MPEESKRENKKELKDFKNHIVMFSGGVASWASALKLSRMLPGQKVWLLFADTLIEDEDLYRFLEDGAKVIPNSQLVRISEGRTPWDVFEDERYINHRVAKCSMRLKQEPCRKWVEDSFDPSDTAVHVGIDWGEYERLEGIQRGWAPYTVFAPLCEDDWWDAARCLEALAEFAIARPRLYDLGFIHNNCGGFCCRAGKKQFSQLLQHFPKRYAEHAKREQQFRDKIGNQQVGILRETRGGKRRIVSLAEFQARGRQLQLVEEVSSCGCFFSPDE